MLASMSRIISIWPIWSVLPREVFSTSPLKPGRLNTGFSSLMLNPPYVGEAFGGRSSVWLAYRPPDSVYWGPTGACTALNDRVRAKGSDRVPPAP